MSKRHSLLSIWSLTEIVFHDFEDGEAVNILRQNVGLLHDGKVDFGRRGIPLHLNGQNFPVGSHHLQIDKGTASLVKK